MATKAEIECSGPSAGSATQLDDSDQRKHECDRTGKRLIEHGAVIILKHRVAPFADRIAAMPRAWPFLIPCGDWRSAVLWWR